MSSQNAQIGPSRRTPHAARNECGNRPSAIDGRTSSSDGYRINQRLRKRVEEIFGWMKTIGGLRKTRYRVTVRSLRTMVDAA
jgi:hypothetical protein